MVSPSSLVVAGIRTHLLSGGKGQPLIFLHGMGASSYGWRRLLPAFAKTHAVYAPDLPGFGRSEKPRDFDYSLVGFTRWLNSFMDTLGLPQAVLIGSSMGGAISIALALDHPARVSRLVLIGTPVDERHIPRIIRIMRTPLLGRLLEPLLGPWLVRVVAPTAFLDQNLVTEELIQEYAIALQTREGRHSIAETMRRGVHKHVAGFLRRYRELKGPVLFIHGEHDCLVHIEDAQRFCREVPQARFFHVPECGHVPHEEKSEIVERAIREFLDSDIMGAK